VEAVREVQAGEGDGVLDRHNAREEAWAEFRAHPSKYTYQELMRFVPEGRTPGVARQGDGRGAEADLGSLIELWLETKEIERLVERLRRGKDSELEALSHYTTEPVAKRLVKSHPAVAARSSERSGCAS
jgi:hypothetical protein